MRKPAIIVIAFVVCLGWFSAAHSQMTDADRKVLLGEIFKLESAQEKINADIRKYDDEIRKCAASISKSGQSRAGEEPQLKKQEQRRTHQEAVGKNPALCEVRQQRH